MKTISELVKEYKNRHTKPKYSSILVGASPNQRFYTNVSNVKIVDGWTEFDSEYQGKHKHIRTQYFINHYEHVIKE